MASSASSLLKLELQATGENTTTWGVKANTVFSRIEESIAEITNIAVTDSNYTLDDTQYAEHDDSTPGQESHVAMVKVTGTLTGNRQVIVPVMASSCRRATSWACSVMGATSRPRRIRSMLTASWRRCLAIST